MECGWWPVLLTFGPRFKLLFLWVLNFLQQHLDKVVVERLEDGRQRLALLLLALKHVILQHVHQRTNKAMSEDLEGQRQHSGWKTFKHVTLQHR